MLSALETAQLDAVSVGTDAVVRDSSEVGTETDPDAFEGASEHDVESTVADAKLSTNDRSMIERLLSLVQELQQREESESSLRRKISDARLRLLEEESLKKDELLAATSVSNADEISRLREELESLRSSRDGLLVDVSSLREEMDRERELRSSEEERHESECAALLASKTTVEVSPNPIRHRGGEGFVWQKMERNLFNLENCEWICGMLLYGC